LLAQQLILRTNAEKLGQVASLRQTQLAMVSLVVVRASQFAISTEQINARYEDLDSSNRRSRYECVGRISSTD
jgi:hypothetical protein